MTVLLFEDLLAATELEPLQEFLTYDELFKMSEPKRFQRSHHVHMPPMEIDQYQTPSHYIFAHYFNAKSDPGHSTTHLRHRGYVKFKKPRDKRATPLSKMQVEVDCECPDYKYRWAWANKQKRAGKIGANSLNQCDNRAPIHTNPRGKPGLCKHLLATKDYIYGLLSAFPKTMGPSDRLDKLTQHATKRWLNFDAEMAAAKERDARIAAAKARRNVGLPPEDQNELPNALAAVEPPAPPEMPEPPATAAPEPPQPPQPPRPPRGPRPPRAPAAPLATPPGKRGRGMPPAPAPKAGLKKPAYQPTPPGKRGRGFPAATTKPKPAAGEIKGLTPGRFLGRRFLKTEGVDSMSNMKTALTLQEAKPAKDAMRLLEGIEDEFGDMPPTEGEGDMPSPEGMDMPVEPPVSDSAVGASTEDNTALALLREIRDLIAALVGDEAEEGGEAPPIPEEDELEPGEGADEGGLGGEEDFKPGKRPMPVPTGAGGE